MVVHIMYKLDERIDVMEQWKRIVMDGVEYPYDVCNRDNKVRSVRTGQLVSVNDDGRGYLKVKLHKNGEQRNFSIHRLVATAFIPNPDNLPEVDHIDRNRYNNNVENLRWVSKQQNIENRDSAECGRKLRVKCVETGVIYESLSEACRILGLHESNLSKCVNGIYKTCGGFHWEMV